MARIHPYGDDRSSPRPAWPRHPEPSPRPPRRHRDRPGAGQRRRGCRRRRDRHRDHRDDRPRDHRHHAHRHNPDGDDPHRHDADHPITGSSSSGISTGPVGNAVHGLDDVASGAGVDLPLSETTQGITDRVDQTVQDTRDGVGGVVGNPNLGQQVGGTVNNVTDGLLGN